MVDFTGGTWRSLIDGSEVSAIPDTELLRWPINEGSGDSITDEVTGKTATTTASWDEGQWFEDWALDFDGTDDRLSYSTSFGDLSEFTLLIECSIHESPDGNDYQIWESDDGNFDNWIQFTDGSNKDIQFDGGLTYSNSGRVIAEPGTDFEVNIGEKFIIGYRYDGNEHSMVGNDQIVATESASGTINIDSHPSEWAYRTSSSRYTDIKIGSVRYNETGLSDSDISNWYNQMPWS